MQEAQNLELPVGTALLFSMHSAAQASQAIEPTAEPTQQWPNVASDQSWRPPLPQVAENQYYPQQQLYATYDPVAVQSSGSNAALYSHLLAASNPAYAHMQANALANVQRFMYGAAMPTSHAIQASSLLANDTEAQLHDSMQVPASRSRASRSDRGASCSSARCATAPTYNAVVPGADLHPRSLSPPNGSSAYNRVQPHTWCAEPKADLESLPQTYVSATTRECHTRSLSPGRLSDPGRGHGSRAHMHGAAVSRSPRRAGRYSRSLSDARSSMSASAEVPYVHVTSDTVRLMHSSPQEVTEQRRTNAVRGAAVTADVGALEGVVPAEQQPRHSMSAPMLSDHQEVEHYSSPRIGRVGSAAAAHRMQQRSRNLIRDQIGASDAARDAASENVSPVSPHTTQNTLDATSVDGTRVVGSAENTITTPLRVARDASAGQLEVPMPQLPVPTIATVSPRTSAPSMASRSPRHMSSDSEAMLQPVTLHHGVEKLQRQPQQAIDTRTVIGVPVDGGYFAGSPTHSIPGSPVHSPVARAAAAAASAANAAAAAASAAAAAAAAANSATETPRERFSAYALAHTGAESTLGISRQSSFSTPRSPQEGAGSQSYPPWCMQPQSLPLSSHPTITMSETKSSPELAGDVNVDFEARESNQTMPAGGNCTSIKSNTMQALSQDGVKAHHVELSSTASGQDTVLGAQRHVKHTTDAPASSGHDSGSRPPYSVALGSGSGSAGGSGTVAGAARTGSKRRSASHYREKVQQAGRWRPESSSAASVSAAAARNSDVQRNPANDCADGCKDDENVPVEGHGEEDPVNTAAVDAASTEAETSEEGMTVTFENNLKRKKEPSCVEHTARENSDYTSEAVQLDLYPISQSAGKSQVASATTVSVDNDAPQHESTARVQRDVDLSPRPHVNWPIVMDGGDGQAFKKDVAGSSGGLFSWPGPPPACTEHVSQGGEDTAKKS